MLTKGDFISPYKDYVRARDRACQCLIDCKIKALPLDFVPLCSNYNTDIIKNSNIPNDNFAKLKPLELGKSFTTLNKSNKNYIIVDDSESFYQQRFILAHEFGHIIIPTLDETEADYFGINILAPACVLWACNIHRIEDLITMCHIPERAAKIRSRRLELLYHRNDFFTSSYEQMVLKQFSEFIKNNRHPK